LQTVASFVQRLGHDRREVMPQDSKRPDVVPGDVEEMHEMACTFAEEFARMGHDGPKILRMFQNPFYAGAYSTYRALGHAATAAIIDQCVARGRTRLCGQPADTATASRSRNPGGRG
jgi:hypothetical protein